MLRLRQSTTGVRPRQCRRLAHVRIAARVHLVAQRVLGEPSAFAPLAPLLKRHRVVGANQRALEDHGLAQQARHPHRHQVEHRGGIEDVHDVEAIAPARELGPQSPGDLREAPYESRVCDGLGHVNRHNPVGAFVWVTRADQDRRFAVARQPLPVSVRRDLGAAVCRRQAAIDDTNPRHGVSLGPFSLRGGGAAACDVLLPLPQDRRAAEDR